MVTMENPITGEFLLTLACFHEKIAHRHKVLLILVTLNISSFVFFFCPKSPGQAADTGGNLPGRRSLAEKNGKYL